MQLGRGFELRQTELRAPRRAEVATYQVHVALKDIEPMIWRRLELPSDLGLPLLHDVLQAAFGWENRHLHLFRKGDFRGEHQEYLMPSSIDDDMEGVLENEVRLDELLSAAGDKLTYEYDFGDSWEHELTLISVDERFLDAPRAVCTGGARSAPPEDCGGVGRYAELIAALADPKHPEHRQLKSWAGPNFDPRRCDLTEIKAALAAAVGRGELAASIPTYLAHLLDRLSGQTADRVWALAAKAGFDLDDDVDIETAAEMTENYRWWLERVGVDGVKLSAAGYLPPGEVTALAEQLGLNQEWIGSFTREVNVFPLQLFRESAQHLGLIRKIKGRLEVTATGRKLQKNPLELWKHIASRLPIQNHETEMIAGALLLLKAATRVDITDGPNTDDWHQLVADVLAQLGWRTAEGPLDINDVVEMQRQTRAVLQRTNTYPVYRMRNKTQRELSPGAGAFARTALRSL